MATAVPDEEQELSELIARLVACDFGEGDGRACEELERFVAGDGERAALRDSVTDLWDELAAVAPPPLSGELAAAASAGAIGPDADGGAGRGRLRIAAAVLPVIAIIGLLLIVAGALRSGESAAEIRAGAATRRLVTLDDGSKVSLSADSAITVALKPHRRDVTLKSGEALFEIAPDPARPFVVSAGGGEVRAVGTAFNLRLSGGAATVTVVEGAVTVAARRAGREARPTQFLGRGQQVTFGEPAAVAPEERPASFIGAVRDVDADRYASWADGFLRFDGEPLSVVIEEVNRYAPEDVRLVDAAIADTPITGLLRIGDTERLRAMIRDSAALDDAAVSRKLVVAGESRRS